MIDALFQALLEVLRWDALSFMLIGIAVGFWVGLLPGLGGGTTLALMLPFVYRMEPVQAFAFLLGMHSVVATTGDITSILFGIPGEGTAAATLLDGYARSKKGQAGRARGASLASSRITALRERPERSASASSRASNSSGSEIITFAIANGQYTR